MESGGRCGLFLSRVRTLRGETRGLDFMRRMITRRGRGHALFPPRLSLAGQARNRSGSEFEIVPPLRMPSTVAANPAAGEGPAKI